MKRDYLSTDRPHNTTTRNHFRLTLILYKTRGFVRISSRLFPLKNGDTLDTPFSNAEPFEKCRPQVYVELHDVSVPSNLLLDQG